MIDDVGGRMLWATYENAVMWCVTLTRGVAPEEVITAYGCDPGDSRFVDMDQAIEWMGDCDPEALLVPLRFGRIGEWSFCYEKSTNVGSINLDVLARLSAKSEAFLLEVGGSGVNHFGYWRNGRAVESFEPTLLSRRPAPPHPWWDAVQERRRAAGKPYPGMLPVLEVVTEHVGAVLDDVTLAGELRTVMVKDPYT
ncbi:DUF6461 domain-containing protein [Streptomyces sp. NPDC060209]|uniref:DUF6461 domain-containing protein n=1 Tax=Streptomyces sp. NPDC060209 TaxID=3347073 RepID=UPI00365B093B